MKKARDDVGLAVQASLLSLQHQSEHFFTSPGSLTTDARLPQISIAPWRPLGEHNVSCCDLAWQLMRYTYVQVRNVPPATSRRSGSSRRRLGDAPSGCQESDDRLLRGLQPSSQRPTIDQA